MRHRFALITTSLVAFTLSATACSEGTSTTGPTSLKADEPTSSTSSSDQVPVIGDLKPGEMPPIPMLILPNLAMVDKAVAGASIDIKDTIGTYPGLTVTPASCDDTGQVRTSTDAMLAYGDGSVTYTDDAKHIQNNGDGSGVYNDGDTLVTVNGDGSGIYNDGETIVTNNGDGSGVYSGETIVTVNGDGSGVYDDSTKTITNNGQGSGIYNDGQTLITNRGDGSGIYNDGQTLITNNGSGTALVNGTEVPADPLPPVPPLGKFPPMGALIPVEYCGTTITLEAGILFDFGKFELRAEANSVLDSLATALTDLGSSTLEISGHTDSVSDDAFNQQLSEDRAEAVTAALESRGVTASIETVGYGETRPVAPNELNGQDNPAGRQLNRRVEIFIPAS